MLLPFNDWLSPRGWRSCLSLLTANCSYNDPQQTRGPRRNALTAIHQNCSKRVLACFGSNYIFWLVECCDSNTIVPFQSCMPPWQVTETISSICGRKGAAAQCSLSVAWLSSPHLLNSFAQLICSTHLQTQGFP